jgi:putative RNA 2'-phosphotransferase
MDEKSLTSLSRVLSKVLRHEPELVGVQLDGQGWVRIENLLAGISRSARRPGAHKRLRTLPAVTLEDLLEVVRRSDKQRFTISEDGERIRAAQGHSVGVDLGYPAIEPPAVLFHGTSAVSWRSIQNEGLRAGSRHAVHLSADADTALRVGARHGRPVVLEVAAKRMYGDGHSFACADNGTWLVEAVPAQYLRLRRS